MSEEVYHAEIKRLAALGAKPQRLEPRDASYSADNPFCGDRVTLDVRMEGDHVHALGHEVKGCMICQAAAATLAEAAPGRSLADLLAEETALRAILAGNEDPTSRWAPFAPLARHRSRHDCALLPFLALKDGKK
ncbi:iron-sulfur cluster assembly scaffold protein [Telmatospirillum sp. J64-1]|uniref:iron-sulfur cluster assembly scaffold protein n=1 Tax=Telmatospirillum sp. J64-1 TaxID=2502183 RepID=UPI00115E9072|nr:iron-sulfur cluster assembly scaffold protein [Telmatospirillum sp. J64-1]